MMDVKQNAPILVVGVGRSGTQLLSWTLGQHPRIEDTSENRYVWTYGAKTRSHDVRLAEEATPQVRQFIRKYFALRRQRSHKIIVDKTPSNVFRVPFLHAVFPEAKILHIIRDGRDNVLSRYQEWFGGRVPAAVKLNGGVPDKGRSYRKEFIRSRIWRLQSVIMGGNIPLVCLPNFLIDNVGPFVKHLVTGIPPRYGERFPGMNAFYRNHGMFATCAVQWREGVMHAVVNGRRLPNELYLETRYENLIRFPTEEWTKIAQFLQLENSEPCLDYLVENVRSDNAEKWKSLMSEDQLEEVESHLAAVLDFLGYIRDR
jgi:hypothetical protein